MSVVNADLGYIIVRPSTISTSNLSRQTGRVPRLADHADHKSGSSSEIPQISEIKSRRGKIPGCKVLPEFAIISAIVEFPTLSWQVLVQITPCLRNLSLVITQSCDREPWLDRGARQPPTWSLQRSHQPPCLWPLLKVAIQKISDSNVDVKSTFSQQNLFREVFEALKNICCCSGCSWAYICQIFILSLTVIEVWNKNQTNNLLVHLRSLILMRFDR